MSWRTAAAAIIAVFALIAVWAIVADPLIQIGDAFKEIETSGQFNHDQRVDGLIGTFFDMFLVAIFGILGWGTYRVLRRERTRGGI